MRSSRLAASISCWARWTGDRPQRVVRPARSRQPRSRAAAVDRRLGRWQYVPLGGVYRLGADRGGGDWPLPRRDHALPDLARAARRGAHPDSPWAEPSRPVWSAATARRRAQADAEGGDRAAVGRSRRLYTRAAGDLHPHAVGVRRAAVRQQDAGGEYQRRGALYRCRWLGDAAGRLHGGLVVEQQVRTARLDARRGDGDQLRDPDGAGPAGDGAVDRPHGPERYRALAAGAPRVVVVPATAGTADLLHFGERRTEPYTNRYRRGGIGDRGGVPHRILRDEVRPLLCCRDGERARRVGADRDAVPGWLVAVRSRSVGAGLSDLPRQDVAGLQPVDPDARNAAAAAHRPVAGVRLEVPVAAGAGEHRGRRARGAALAAERPGAGGFLPGLRRGQRRAERGADRRVLARVRSPQDHGATARPARAGSARLYAAVIRALYRLSGRWGILARGTS